MFKVNNKWTYFAPFFSVSIVVFEQVNVSWGPSWMVNQENLLNLNSTEPPKNH